METRINVLEKGQKALGTLFGYYRLFEKSHHLKISFRVGRLQSIPN